MASVTPAEAWKPGYYTDTTNGDLWRLDTIAGKERWSWINGNKWSFVPREHLVLNDRLTNG